MAKKQVIAYLHTHWDREWYRTKEEFNLRLLEVFDEILEELDDNRPKLPQDVIEQVEIEIKYEGYIVRQRRQVEQYKKMEHKKIPDSLDYNDVKSLRIEARQKLQNYRPASLGQASRISGVSPADISVLLIYLEHFQG